MGGGEERRKVCVEYQANIYFPVLYGFFFCKEKQQFQLNITKQLFQTCLRQNPLIKKNLVLLKVEKWFLALILFK